MLCTFCNSARLNNEAPCPHCGAPSPLLSSFAAAGPPATQWGSNASSPSNLQLNNQALYHLPETPPQAEQQQPMSLLPVPYQPQQPFMNWQTNPTQGGNAMVQVPLQNMGAFSPTLPGDGVDGAVYVPPMYTKPRAIIPRYRVISGLLSLLIVAALLCTGTGYYLNTSGKLAALGQFYGLIPPPSIKPATISLADPKSNPDFGPAYSIINSATTNTRIDPVSHASAQPANIFQINQTIYLTYSVQRPKTPGVMVIKWFTNGSFYQSPTPIQVSTSAITGYTSQKYTQPAEGTVELYWDDQLAIRLYFVVR
jgi:hypothetical protein